MNRYAYTWNDPVNLVDPLGLLVGVDFSMQCAIEGMIVPCSMVFNSPGGGMWIPLEHWNELAEAWVQDDSVFIGPDWGGDDFVDPPGDGNQTGQTAADNPCATAQNVAVPVEGQRGQLEATGSAFTSLSFSRSGDLNGATIYFQHAYHLGGGAAVLPLTTVRVSYSGASAGLSISTTGGGIELPSTSSQFNSTVTSLRFQGGAVTQLSGALFWQGLVPMPFGSTLIKNALNNSQEALAALEEVSLFFGKCDRQ